MTLLVPTLSSAMHDANHLICCKDFTPDLLAPHLVFYKLLFSSLPCSSYFLSAYSFKPCYI